MLGEFSEDIFLWHGRLAGGDSNEFSSNTRKDLNGEHNGEEAGDGIVSEFEFELSVPDKFNGFWGDGDSAGENACIGGVEQVFVTADIMLPKDCWFGKPITSWGAFFDDLRIAGRGEPKLGFSSWSKKLGLVCFFFEFGKNCGEKWK